MDPAGSSEGKPFRQIRMCLGRGFRRRIDNRAKLMISQTLAVTRYRRTGPE